MYENNQFDNSTSDDQGLMLVLGSDHTSRLAAHALDPVIGPLLVRTTPLNTAYSDAYTAHRNAVGSRKGSTLLVEQLLNDLSSTRIKQWDIQIQNVHLEGTPDYMVLMPNHRKPFQSGGIDERIAQVKGLGLRLADYPALVDTMTAVNAFHTTLKTARDTQQQREQIIDQRSSQLEVARVALARIMYGNLGVLMDLYRDTPTFIADFWEVSLMQSGKKSRNFTGTVDGSKTVNLTALVGPKAKMVITNTGHTELLFCLAPAGTDVCIMGVKVLPGETKEVERTDLGSPTDKALNCTNASPDTTGSYDVDVIG
jgi:hypothetical protein